MLQNCFPDFYKMMLTSEMMKIAHWRPWFSIRRLSTGHNPTRQQVIALLRTSIRQSCRMLPSMLERADMCDYGNHLRPAKSYV